MADTAEKRILAVAKEFNVGLSHIVEALNAKGFSVEAKPTTKISGEMYDVLLKEFGQDKALKAQADKVNIGIGAKTIIANKAEAAAEISKKKEEEKISAEKNVKKEEPKPVEKKPEVKVEKKKEEPIVPEKIKMEAEKVQSPKVLGKIELPVEEDKSSKGKKKSAKKTEEVKEEKPKKGKAKKGKDVIDEIKIEEVKPTPTAPDEPSISEEKKDEAPPEHHDTKFQKLSGFKEIGKIDLSTIKKDKPAESSKDKRQRQRIPKTSSRVNLTDLRAFKPREGDAKPAERTGGAKPQDQRRADPRRPQQGGRRDVPAKKPAGGPPVEISEKEIQEKIRQTMANLNAQTKGRSAKSKYRRLKRDEAADDAANEIVITGKLQVTEFISVAELASLLDVAVTQVIANCMSLGIIVSINQRLDAEIIELVAHEFGKEVEFISAEEQSDFEEDEIDKEEDLLPRPPIVTIMGHVDHGKTSLLDFIRQANVVAGEKGGITQHIGAYEVELANGKLISFLDTPGHEAFTAMRARGAKVTDIAVIVIAADDSVMPQTKEAISHAQAANVPMIFAFNKMDRPGANADNIRQQLANMNILVEEWGGKFQSQEISAKQGTNVDTLLDKIILESDLLNLKANPNKNALGSVIEASLDKGRGFISTILVQEGTLKAGDIMVAGSSFGKVKAMFNERGQKVNSAGPSTPVVVLGLDGAPTAGEKFKVFDYEADAKELATKRKQIIREQGIRTKKHITLDEIGRRLALGNFKELNIIVKGDFDGSVEALTDSLLKLSTPEIQVKVVHKGVGQITESDILLASASDAIVLGFQVRPSLSARKLAEQENIDVRLYSIIYNAIDELKSAMEGMLEPKIEEKIVANVEVREVFKITKVGTVAGCFVTEGKIARNNKVRLVREGIVVYSGELNALKRFKDEVKDVSSGMECGISIKNFNDIKAGDIIEAYEETEVKRTL